MKKALFTLLLLTASGVEAKDIYVKYRGGVNVYNEHFQKLSLQESSLVKSMYYDRTNKYLLVRIRETYYHYCSIPSRTIEQWIESASLERYYRTYIRGNYDCRINPIPSY
jgi:hypothetical protein